jgi:hypothetical protein
MAASDYVPIFFKNRLHLAGRPQMSTLQNSHHGTERTIIARPRPNALADVALGAKEANTLSTSLQLVAGDPVIAPPGQ